MNQRQKEVLKSQLRDEKKIINDLKKIYIEALTDINQKVAVLMVDESMQSKIYQVGYQNRLKKQIEASLELLNSGQYEKIHNYLQDCYSSGFIGAMYDLHGQGIPLIMPIDQKAMVKAVQTDSKISKGLYTKLGKDVGDLKKRITSEVSRGVAQALPYKDVTRNLNNVARIGLNRSMRIARTEGHRITQASALDGMRTAKSAGADVLKQWDATLDGHTRDHHRELDGQIRDVDDDFEVGGMTVEAPGMFGDPAEDCNCRCCLLQRARWELDESELDTLRERADYFGLDKEKDFDDFKVKYLNSVEKIGKRGTILPMNLQLFANIPEEKFTKYALDPTKSPDKAKAFQSALGYNKSNYNKLIENIKNNIDENKFVKKGDKGHGMLYEYVMELKGENGKKANVMTAWIDDGGEKRLTSVYVTRKKATK
ncbi:MAG: phage minor head protein [Clostridium sp.]